MLCMAPAASQAQLAEQHTAAPPRALQPPSKMLLCWQCHAIVRCCFCCAVVQEPAAVASCCLIKRSSPPRMPPRLVVLTGPSAVGRGKLVARLIDEFPDKFGATISHTSRTPKEHEVDGRYCLYATCWESAAASAVGPSSSPGKLACDAVAQPAAAMLCMLKCPSLWFFCIICRSCVVHAELLSC